MMPRDARYMKRIAQAPILLTVSSVKNHADPLLMLSRVYRQSKGRLLIPVVTKAYSRLMSTSPDAISRNHACRTSG